MSSALLFFVSTGADRVALSCSALLMPFSTGAASLLIQSELCAPSLHHRHNAFPVHLPVTFPSSIFHPVFAFIVFSGFIVVALSLLVHGVRFV